MPAFTLQRNNFYSMGAIANNFPKVLVLSAFPVISTITIQPAQAAQLTIQNASFDQGITLPSDGFTTSVSGWTQEAQTNPDGTIGQISSGIYRPASSRFDAPLSPDGYVTYVNAGFISQQLTDTLAPDTNYTLNVDVGWRNDLGGFASTIPNFTVQLYAGVQLLEEDTLAELIARNSLSSPNNLASFPLGQFFDSTLTFTSTSSTLGLGERLTIRLFSAGAQTNFDNVSLLADPIATPTPSPDPSPAPSPDPSPSPNPDPSPSPNPDPSPSPSPDPSPSPSPDPSPSPSPDPSPSPSPDPSPSPSPDPSPSPSPDPSPAPSPDPSPSPSPDPDPVSVPEPSSVLGLLMLSTMGAKFWLKRRQ
ncbi:MAG: PEP-CTERM sorting domain-containing protein [Oculatellaceae cyanobacterium bins.114]|nr:PEP-CTERM sorting domain-containing protein [Oculatellaceae cyanobacterium bins.114]